MRFGINRLLLLIMLVMSCSAGAIVIRDDVDDSNYRILPSEFPALVDMPGEGHGVLIAPQWVITAAHAITWQPEIKQVTDALPLEGGSGSGDSGGPILVQTEKDWSLAGLTSWIDIQSAIRTPGRYGQISCNVRLSHYKEWIESMISANGTAIN